MMNKRSSRRLARWALVPAVLMGFGAVVRADPSDRPAPALVADHAPMAQQHVSDIVKPYLAAQKLLADDKLDGLAAELKKVKSAAAMLAEHAGGKLKTQAAAVVKAAEAEPKDLKQAREAFKPLSTAVIALVQTVPPSADAAPTLYEASCAMAKANWLQGTKEIVNPYMGKEMLTCGEVVKKVEPSPGGKK